ncbi:MAG: Ldh family oxidoreductase [Chloroflexi bacterium]|nr:Ldh family oxidoreductase [Chloroflexota bacterium]
METDADSVVVDARRLEQFVVSVFTTLGLTEANARDAADVLVKSDIYGIESHGIPRLAGYVNRLKSGAMTINPEVVIVHELPSTAMVDGANGLGMIVGKRAMEVAIRKAQATGAGFVSVRNSSHFGIAGYYARMALEHDMIGFCMTNVGSGGNTPPTGGRTGFFGTNPIAVAAPTNTPPAFVMDFATTVVASGKLQIAQRRNHDVPLGWIINGDGVPSTNPAERHGGGYILPLGGLRETGGHKGYGLMLLVDILSGVLSGAAVGATASKLTPEGARAEQERSVGDASNTGHFFGALLVDGFRPVEEFKTEMDEMFRVIRSSERLPGWERIYVHGETEWEAERDRLANGIPLDLPTYQSLEGISADLGVPLNVKIVKNVKT